ncbi:MAG: purine-nucleoside phosphorylase [Sulfurospirillum sp.]|nr:MAG: purine-nucleoside phosphorylase [Sulfurospirillum sp.]
MIVCAGDIESFDFAKPIGIGLIESAISLTDLILNSNPIEITFIGTAGSYGDYEIFDIVTSASSSQIEHSLLLDTSYSPIQNQIVSHETEPIVNSSNYITTDSKISKMYIKQGISLENMEFYSVLRVAKRYNIKAKGIFVVTNYCNKDAHKEFLKNHNKAKNLLEEFIKG